ncbi:unnamed protein product [[Candida] boidinii]|uniref:Unnamed protein product n=1 Tax=Candida boidinii TaxID=5477 RepID=A0ACB5TH71_CANBO|nr:unnamed protein product [[Candida] boidinii]
MDVIMNNSENLNTITHLNQQITKPITNTTTTTSYISRSQRRGSNHSAKSPKSSTSSLIPNHHHQYEDLNSLILPPPITDSPISPASPSSPASPQISTIANINNSCNNHRHILPNRSSKSTEATILTHTLPRRSLSMNSQISPHLNFSNISPQTGSSSSTSIIPPSSASSSSSSSSSSQYTQSDSNQLLKSPARVRSPSSSLTARSSKSLSPRLNSFKFESLNNMGNYDSPISNSNGEHLIETMEKEQEGLVLKLMREIQALKEENRHLKQQLSNYNRCSSPINSLTNNNININNTNSSTGLISHNPSISSSNSNNNNNLIFSNLSDFNVNSNNNSSSNSGNNGVNNNGSNGLNFSNLQRRRSASVSAVRTDSGDLKMDNTTINNNNNSHNNYHTTNNNRNSISSVGSQFSSNSNSSGLLTRRSTITSLNSQKRLPTFNSVSSTNSLNLSIPDIDYSSNSISNSNTNTNYLHPSLMISGGNESLRKNRKMGGFNNSHQDKFENYNISAAMNK